MVISMQSITEKMVNLIDTIKAEETEPIIEAKSLGVRYRVGTKREDIQSLSYNLLLKKRRKDKKDFWALKDISFKCYPGEILGIIGSNGAGKTTLCKVISGLIKPNKGKIKVDGEVSALFSLGTGFNQELSGRENIFLNAMMLGFSKKEVEKLLPDIIDFSGVKDFIDQPIKYYSSGMKARLGFSIAAMLEPEILVLDEALSTGDLEFSEKAAKKMQEIVKKAKLVIVVTHSIDFVHKYCTKALWIDNGVIRLSGSPHEVTKTYKETIVTTKHVKRIDRPKKVANLNETNSNVGELNVVTAKNVGLKYTFTTDSNNKWKNTITNLTTTVKSFWALQDISFSINEGEIVGIIGPNGAGKSTLCKVISNILKCDKGYVIVNGDISALLSFGTGFNIQLSGKDNILLNGMMLGIPKKKLLRIYKDIIEFSELDKFIDKPIKQYSSGMRSRLGFSIAAMIQPDIFIIDEALNAGDIAFYEKASAKIQELIEEAKAVIVVTHSLHFVEKVCTRAIWLNKGTIKLDGDPKEVIAMYRQSVK